MNRPPAGKRPAVGFGTPVSAEAAQREQVLRELFADKPAPPPWPDLRTSHARPRLIAALMVVREGGDAAEIAARVRALAVQPAAVEIRVREYGLALIRRASDAQLGVIADYPSPMLIAAMTDPAPVLELLADPGVAARVAAYQATHVPSFTDAGFAPWSTPPAWRSALGRPLRRGE
jgi:hypothetical protein